MVPVTRRRRQATSAWLIRTNAWARLTAVALINFVDSSSDRCSNISVFEHFLERMNMAHPRGKAVTRADLCESVYRKVGLSRNESAKLVEMVLKEITDCIAHGEQVKLSSFATFSVRKKGGRLGRNPKTGVDVPIAGRRVVVFKASGILKRQVNTKQPVRGNGSVAAEAQVE
jgi:integration host factor subunit alpha